MRRHERTDEAVTVTYANQPVDRQAQRVEALSANELLDAVTRSTNPGNLIVVLDPACVAEASPDEVADHIIALSSVLVRHGVRAFETHYVVAVTRVFAMYQAIHTGIVDGELGEVVS